MRTYIKSGLKSLILIIPFILYLLVRFLFPLCPDNDYINILKATVLFSCVSIALTFITSFITHSIIKKRINLKKWHESGIKSFNIIVPISSLLALFGVLVFLPGILNTLLLIIFFFCMTLLLTIILGIPISIIVTRISYFINQK